ncbi:hypothetical protein BH11BAC3_BH11BAC3_33040 [soil metagenome]
MKNYFLFLLFVVFCAKSNAQNCNDWLNTPSQPSYAEMGQINITGNKITVEATFNRTTPYVGGLLYAGDLVSKHNTPLDCNYLLRPNDAEITTTNGYFRTPDICEIELNKTYHVAMVYDGATLKFYRNGFLMSQIAATGTLLQNNWTTRVGFYQPQTYNQNFIGYINEVRIWNVAKSQSAIRTFMTSSLPSPSTQPGLVAYYTFDDLVNKQGNAAYNGTLGGAATINRVNPSCNIIADSCKIVGSVGIQDIINTYTPVIGLAPCNNTVLVQDASTFKIGDTVLIIQMKGAIIDSSNTAAFGSITNYQNAGNYEFNYVKAKTGNSIELKNNLTRQYDIINGKVQLISVPLFNKVKVTSTLTCLPWDGNVGGVLAFNVNDTLELMANIDVTGKGFSGGLVNNPKSNSYYCHENEYYYSNDPLKAAPKGEGITSISVFKSFGKGSLANGGGGGSEHNSGGAGGSNAAMGGTGGNEWITCGPPSANGGIGGIPLIYSNSSNKVFLGGGGGGGHCDNVPGFNPNGGNGGGIVIIQTNVIKLNSFSIIANGGNAVECVRDNQAFKCHEGMGGGGGGGAVLLQSKIFADPVNIEVKGGKGADMNGELAGKLGPGGGGGGGSCWLSSGSLPTGNILLDGGKNGVNIDFSNDSFGATSGLAGMTLLKLIIPIDTTPHTPNIDSVRIGKTITSCQGVDFKALTYTKNFAINKWDWDFGDNNFASTQNTTHIYSDTGTYLVKLVVTDINGCKDSISTNVLIFNGLSFDFSYKQDICNPLSVQFFNIGSVTNNAYWSFGDGHISTGNVSPTNIYSNAGNYVVKFSVQSGSCTDTISKTININLLKDDIIITRDTTVCFNGTTQLNTKSALSFCWSPITYLDDPFSPNPVTATPVPITYYFTAEMQGINLISNGDFSLGNTGFTSQYNYANPNTKEGEYFVGTSAQAWNGLLGNCTDHTTSSGNMMLVNGAPVADVNVWTETVAVTPNTNYAFSTWIQALYPPNPAQLSFSINGGTLGNLITASLPTCTWTQFYTTWNSGNNTSATISIVNKNTLVQGNDFALDDISFSAVLIKRDSVKITIDTPSVKTIADTSLCAGSSVKLTSSGAATYSWTPTSGLSNTTISDPVSLPATTTQYIVSGTNSYGCTAKDTVVITVKNKPIITKSSDTSICRNTPLQLSASGGSTYTWAPSTTLNNASIAMPVASPVTNTTYVVTVTGTNSCYDSAFIKVNIRATPTFSISPDNKTCTNKMVQLTAGGGTSYLWSPSALVTDPTSSAPTTKNNITTTFSVKIKDNTCNDSVTLTTIVKIVPPPSIKISKSNDIDCFLASSQLTATGANSYNWIPSTGLSSSNISNPITTITAPQQYVVTGTDTSTGCTGNATITVSIKPPFEPKFFVPNAFSPNGDGLNDCFRINHFGTVGSAEISIYNRLGNLVFHSSNINECWDGYYKGGIAEPGNYVYYIKTYNNCGENTQKGNLILVR